VSEKEFSYAVTKTLLSYSYYLLLY